MPNLLVNLAPVERVFVDMDGVLSDLNQGFIERAGMEDPYNDHQMRGVWDWWEKMGLKPMAWKTVNDVEFWASLPRMPAADALLEFLLTLFRPEQIAICTTPPRSAPHASEGKDLWIARHYPWFEGRVVKTEAKEVCSGPDALLLDDGPHNVEAFRVRGQAVLMPTLGNANHPHADDPVGYLASLLRRW